MTDCKIGDEPWNDHDPLTQDCPDCDGDGYLQESSCCNAEIIFSDICSLCGENCDCAECERCEGTGQIPIEPDEYETED